MSVAAAAAAAAPLEHLLLDLGPLVTGRVLARPSKSIKTPYVADVQLLDGSDTVVQAHCPSMGCAGMAVPGSMVRMEARPESESGKAPTRKTTHSIHLAVDPTRATVDAGGNTVDEAEPPVVGAHPMLAERIARACLEQQLIPELGTGYAVGGQQTFHNSRVDFVLTHGTEDGAARTLLEVKNVVCADYTAHEMPRQDKLRRRYHALPARDSDVANKDGSEDVNDAAEPSMLRSAIFPDGKCKPKVKVVSDRAIKHVHELTELHRSRDGAEHPLRAAVLFIVNRGDCDAFRPCHEACPLFARVVYEAHQAGVLVLAYDVRWRGSQCFLGRSLPVRFSPDTTNAALDADWLQRVLQFNAESAPTHAPSAAATKKRKANQAEAG